MEEVVKRLEQFAATSACMAAQIEKEPDGICAWEHGYNRGEEAAFRLAAAMVRRAMNSSPRFVGGVWDGMTPAEVLAERDAFNRLLPGKREF